MSVHTNADADMAVTPDDNPDTDTAALLDASTLQITRHTYGNNLLKWLSLQMTFLTLTLTLL
jgi:hypothetical protein